MEKGIEKLIEDLKNLVFMAEQGKFSDFDDNALPAPKMALVSELDLIRSNTVNGKYDG